MRLGELGDARSGGRPSSGLRSVTRAQQHVAALARGRHAAGVLLRVHRWSAIRSASAASRASAGARSRRRSSRSRSPRRARTAPARRPRAACRPPRSRVEQRAELVAAHAEGASAVVEVGRAGSRPRRVSSASPGGMAERVVVVLEAVEVEQREHERRARAHVGQQLGRARGVSARRLPRPVSASVSASVRDARSIATFARNVSARRTITKSQGGRREPDGEHVHVPQRSVDEQLEPDRAGHERRGDRPAGRRLRGAGGAAAAPARRRRRSAPGRPTSRRRTSRRPRTSRPRCGRGTASRPARRRGCPRRAAATAVQAPARARPGRRRRRPAGSGR